MNRDAQNKQKQYSLISIAFPVVAFGTMYLYQTIIYADFWGSLHTTDDAGRTAGAITTFSQALQWIYWIGGACVIGFILAVRSAKLTEKPTPLQLLAFALNGCPLLLLTIGVLNLVG